MISSYVLITISILAVVFYSTIGYKKSNFAYLAAVVPFIAAILVNILLPQWNAIQIGLLSILLALTFGFMLRQNDKKKCF